MILKFLPLKQGKQGAAIILLNFLRSVFSRMCVLISSYPFFYFVSMKGEIETKRKKKIEKKRKKKEGLYQLESDHMHKNHCCTKCR